MRDPRVIGLLILIPLILSPIRGLASPVRDLLDRAQKQRVYRAALPIEIQQARRLFERMLNGEQSVALQQDWRALGFTLKTVFEKNQTFLVLSESHDAQFGRGFYLFNASPKLSLALQAPHSFRDLHTEKLALALALEHHVVAGAWNTVPRSFDDRGVLINADMAHLSQSYFLAFSQAFATVYPTGTVLQLHGFAKRKRTTSAGAKADVIISSGTDAPSAVVLEFGRCLKPRLSSREVYLYPQDVRELGGTKNTVGQSLRELGHRGFIHLELSKQLREQMASKVSLRYLIIDCLPLTTP